MIQINIRRIFTEKIFPVIAKDYTVYLECNHKQPRMKRLFQMGLLTLKHTPDFISIKTGKYILFRRVEIVLTTKCSLCCKDCANLIQYYNIRGGVKPSYHIKHSENIRAIRRLLSITDEIHDFGILGGEPFLYPQLFDIVKLLIEQEKIFQVRITTNGTVLPKDEKLLNLLSSNKILVVISNYGDKSKFLPELEKVFSEKGIRYEVFLENGQWVDFGGIEYRNRTEDKLRRQFRNCRSFDHSMIHGKIHVCPRSSNGMDLGIVPNCPDEYIDLFEEGISKKELRKKLWKFIQRSGLKKVTACNYCDQGVYPLKMITPGLQR